MRECSTSSRPAACGTEGRALSSKELSNPFDLTDIYRNKPAAHEGQLRNCWRMRPGQNGLGCLQAALFKSVPFYSTGEMISFLSFRARIMRSSGRNSNACSSVLLDSNALLHFLDQLGLYQMHSHFHFSHGTFARAYLTLLWIPNAMRLDLMKETLLLLWQNL